MIAVIPQPVSVQMRAGHFVLTNRTVIEVAGSDADARRVAQFLSARLSAPTGYRLVVRAGTQRARGSAASAPASGRIRLSLIHDGALGPEGYKLTVAPASVRLTANTAAGLFYGTQTLLQLLPKEIESASPVHNVRWLIPAVNITDYPRFKWRGLMFDVARHFFTRQDVEQYIDQMVRYKYNLLHLHLTDDEGWRIEIKSLPRLTQVGAWNVKKVGYFGTFSPPAPDEPRNYGGFYTQDDIRDIVRYAKDRFVDILPEIDVPGHSLAAVVSYPDVSCTAGADSYRVGSGEPFMDWSHGAPPVAMVDNTLCPANEKTYAFLDKVLTEMAQLFPFEYIHMGGDECPKNFWQKSADVQALAAKEGLKTMEEVQSYFEKRLETMVASKGKRLIGWDEILEGGLAPGAAVMSWRGIKGGIEAANMKHEVVMSPTTFAYLDYMQGDPVIEPRVYATLRLSTAYAFEPAPEGIDPQYVKGGQANLWTEQVYNMRHAEYMTWPRGMAIAESLWSPRESKHWDEFFSRVEQHFGRLDEAEINYAPSAYDPIFAASRDAQGALSIELTTEVKGLDIYYTFDNSFPDRFYPKYTGPLTPPKDAVMLKLISYRGRQPVGRMIAMPIDELQKRADHKGDSE